MSTILRAILKTLVRLIRATLIAFFVVISTTYGWWLFLPKFQELPFLKASSERLEKTVRYLSEDIGVRNYAAYDKLESAAQYIKKSFKDLDYFVEDWQYEVKGSQFKNIVAKLKNNDSQEYILIGAHYDSCFTPGADDNGSGIAGLLELARAVRHEKIKANILFVAFTNEEPPFFMTSNMGSKVFIKHLQERRMVVQKAIILEMLGSYSDKWFSQRYLPLLGLFFPNKGDFVALVGNFKSKKLVDFIHKKFNEQKLFPMRSIIAPSVIPGINFSDHSSFWEAGMLAVMVTDTAYLRNQNYHKKTDTVDKLDFEKMAAVIEGLKRTIVQLANK